MTSPFFITASGTDIGKTFIITALCWQLRQRRHSVTALKPVISGFDPRDSASDTALILQSCGLKPTPQTMKAISPWQFSAPLAPNLAAQKEHGFVVFDEVVAFCQEHTAIKSDIVLVEGVGGVMAPLDNKHTVLDWMTELRWPTVLVGGSYLGAISHSLTALEMLRARRVPVSALVISESAKSQVSLEETAIGLASFVPSSIPLVKLPRVRAPEEPWKHAPNISWICAETKERKIHET